MSNTLEGQYLKRKRSRTIVYIELIFVLLPFAFLAIKRLSLEIFLVPEWSLVASILFGQTVAKLISGLFKYNLKTKWHVGAFYTTVCVAMSLISVYVYSITEENSSDFTVYTVLQFLLFFLALTTFIVFGAIGQRLMEIPEK